MLLDWAFCLMVYTILAVIYVFGVVALLGGLIYLLGPHS